MKSTYMYTTERNTFCKNGKCFCSLATSHRLKSIVTSANLSLSFLTFTKLLKSYLFDCRSAGDF